jgi:hypothetical protein
MRPPRINGPLVDLVQQLLKAQWNSRTPKRWHMIPNSHVQARSVTQNRARLDHPYEFLQIGYYHLIDCKEPPVRFELDRRGLSLDALNEVRLLDKERKLPVADHAGSGSFDPA